MVKSAVHRTEKFLIRCYFYAMYMRSGGSFGNSTSKSLMKNSICNLGNSAILTQTHHADSSVMVTSDKEVTILIIKFYITATHSANPLFVNRNQISVRLDGKGFHSFIRDRIEVFSTVGNNQIRWIIDWNNFSLC